jgi:hypothetical protein
MIHEHDPAVPTVQPQGWSVPDVGVMALQDDSRPDVVPHRTYWFVSYLAAGRFNGYGRATGYGNTVIDKHPAQWAFETSLDKRITDGPYVLLCAVRIDKQTYDKQRGLW